MLIAALVAFQLLIFMALIVTLRRILTRNVASATKHLDELNQDYTRKEEEATRQLEEAKQKAEEMVTKSREEAEALKMRIIKESNLEGDKIVDQARAKSDEIIQQADKVRELMVSEMEKRIAKEAVNKACELIQFVLPERLKREAHSQLIEELNEGGFAQLERLRVPSDISETKIISAFNLSEAERKSISKRLKDVLGREVPMKEEIDSGIVAGLIIHIGSLVLDGSLKNKIEEQAKNVKYAPSER